LISQVTMRSCNSVVVPSLPPPSSSTFSKIIVADRVPATARVAPARTRNQATGPANSGARWRTGAVRPGAGRPGTAWGGQGPPDQAADPAAGGGEGGLEQRLAVECHRAKALGQALAQEHRQDAVPGADDGAQHQAVALTGPGQGAA
jgi:hypothetical protein